MEKGTDDKYKLDTFFSYLIIYDVGTCKNEYRQYLGQNGRKFYFCFFNNISTNSILNMSTFYDYESCTCKFDIMTYIQLQKFLPAISISIIL